MLKNILLAHERNLNKINSRKNHETNFFQLFLHIFDWLAGLKLPTYHRDAVECTLIYNNQGTIIGLGYNSGQFYRQELIAPLVKRKMSVYCLYMLFYKQFASPYISPYFT